MPDTYSQSKIFPPAELRELASERIRWEMWERLIAENGITVDRPHGSHHPDHPSIIYPIDYGYVNDTMATDGHELDVFVGSAETGLVGTMITLDHRKGDTEFKLIYNATPEEVYLVNGFINFDWSLMEGVLVMRFGMGELWSVVGGR